MKRFICILMLLAAAPAHAGPRTGANYSITTDTTDSGGGRTTGGGVVNDGSLGGIGGISSAGAAVAKDGYAGQLYDVTGLTLTAGAATVNETATVQLGARQSLDDATFLAVAANSVAWSVVSGPVSGISAGGLATAGVVAQDTPATVQGGFSGFTGTYNFTVLDSIPDNFGAYAADGIGDDWQVQYFGPNNPNAGPGFISDGSGLTNLFKYTAGLVPNNAASTFLLNNAPVTGQPGQQQITLGPTFSDRTYTIEFSLDLSGWNTLGPAFPGNGGTQIITDTNASGPHKFYRVSVNKP
ncbi:MAG TPA: hypothetical protein DIT64_04075 [Verrucomicrobiales bacterium]|nr:hypothetical protein [Verrucomicrobiales bacterium]